MMDQPNQNANKEPAEGSRETVRANEERGTKERGTPGSANEPASGISNRPLEHEQNEQADVPPRGHTKDEERENA
jgi:hypothetical protein